MRNRSLDILRAVAILLVFCYHSEGALLVSRFGWTGVDLFFVLSGYLVSGLLFREYRLTGGVRPGRFLLRRGFKIYPQFYLLTGVTVVGTYVVANGPVWGQVSAEAFFYQNYARGLWGHTWSLAVEEHFYLLLCAAVISMARRGGEDPFRLLPLWIAGAAAGVLGLRVATWLAGPEITEYGNVFPSHLRMDSFLGGVLVAYYQVFHPERMREWMRKTAPWLAPASIALLAPVSFLKREDPFMVTVGFTMVSWAFVLLLLSVLYPVRPMGDGWGSRAMVQLGQMSYAFYLWRAPVILAGDWIGGMPVNVKLVATFATSFVLAYASTRWVEAPMLRLRDRMVPAPAPRTEPAGSLARVG